MMRARGDATGGNGGRGAPRSPAACAAAALLVAGTLAAFRGVLGLGFVFDDHHYLHLNPIVKDGLTTAGVRAAFSTTHSANWHPLTWISHMVDVELFGLEPAGHHAVNLLFHAANAALVFALLRSLTGALWRPAVVASLFAVHPLRVESVAWIAERKDVLSAFLGLLCLRAYVPYARAPALRRAAAVACLLALGLLAKPMLVTLPLLMLLLDWWPLGRAGARPTAARFLRLAAEKAPLLLLAGASSWATLHAQGAWGAVIGPGFLPIEARVATAVSSLLGYLREMALPMDLAIPYPLRAGIPLAELAGDGTLLLGISAFALARRRGMPFLLVGWIWYLVVLLPVIGIVQVGSQAMADRYTYLPQLGVYFGVVWALAPLAARRRAARRAAAAAVLVCLALCSAVTGRQVLNWKDDLALFSHALKVTPDNWLAHRNLGLALQEQGRHREAKRHYEETLRLFPDHPGTNRSLGAILGAEGDREGAKQRFRRALAADPADAASHADLAALLVAEGSVDEGLSRYREALRLLPHDPDLLSAYAGALAAADRTAEAEAAYRELVRLAPRDAVAHLNHGAALALLGRRVEAERALREALRLQPDLPLAHRNLASLLEARGATAEAVAHYREAARLDPADDVSRRRIEELASPGRPRFPPSAGDPRSPHGGEPPMFPPGSLMKAPTKTD